MKNFTSEKRQVWQLMVDDWIKIGSALYRIKDVRRAAYSDAQMALTLVPAVGDPVATVTMIAPRSATFKVHNQ